MENGRSRLQQAQENVEEVKVIMLENLNKADERSGKLGELESRADQLQEMSKSFSKTTTKVKNQKRWENMKMKVIIVVGAIVLCAIIGIIVYSLSGSGSPTESSPMDEEKSLRSTTESG